jgi:hypothetical protein
LVRIVFDSFPKLYTLTLSSIQDGWLFNFWFSCIYTGQVLFLGSWFWSFQSYAPYLCIQW